MNTKQMRRAQCPAGYWFVNTALLGFPPNWELQVAPLPANDRLFGYEREAFMAKQYAPLRRTA